MTVEQLVERPLPGAADRARDHGDVRGVSERAAAVLLEAMRPKQWLKNAFVLAGLIFAGKLSDPGAALRALTMLAAFCMASSASYLFNDAHDAEHDRHNPRTAGRPIARGALSARVALGAAGALAVAALAIGAALGPAPVGVLGGYLLLQVAYSRVLKHILFVDVMAIALGFLLRVVAGVVAIDVVMSSWLALCTSLLALFLGLMKRRAEVVALGGMSHPGRPLLDQYSIGLLDELIAVVTPATLVVYCLYAVLGAHSDAMLGTVPFVLYGIFRALFLIHHRSEVTEEPTSLVWKDRPLLVCVALWGAASGVITLIAG